MLIYLYAITLAPLTDIIAFSLIGPIITAFFAFIFFKESISYYQLLALGLGIIGALCIIRPGFIEFNIAYFYMFTVLLLWAFVIMIIKLLGRTESTFVQLFWLSTFCTLLSFPFALANWGLPTTLHAWALLITITTLYILNGIAVFNAFRSGSIAILMPFIYTQVIVAAFWGYVLFDETLSIYTATGAGIIIAGNVLAAHKAKKTKDSL